MQFARFGGNPRRNGKSVNAGKLFRSRREVGILHVARITENRREQRRRIGQCLCVGRDIELVEKVRKATVERITVDHELRNFGQCFRSHTLPSSNKPSTRYCVFTGMRLAG